MRRRPRCARSPGDRPQPLGDERRVALARARGAPSPTASPVDAGVDENSVSKRYSGPSRASAAAVVTSFTFDAGFRRTSASFAKSTWPLSTSATSTPARAPASGPPSTMARSAASSSRLPAAGSAAWEGTGEKGEERREPGRREVASSLELPLPPERRARGGHPGCPAIAGMLEDCEKFRAALTFRRTRPLGWPRETGSHGRRGRRGRASHHRGARALRGVPPKEGPPAHRGARGHRRGGARPLGPLPHRGAHRGPQGAGHPRLEGDRVPDAAAPRGGRHPPAGDRSRATRRATRPPSATSTTTTSSAAAAAKVVEFGFEAFEILQREVAGRYGFRLETHHHELVGTCPECLDEGARPGAPPPTSRRRSDQRPAGVVSRGCADRGAVGEARLAPARRAARRARATSGAREPERAADREVELALRRGGRASRAGRS